MSSPCEYALFAALLGQNELVRAGAARLAAESTKLRRPLRPALARLLCGLADRLEGVTRPTLGPSIAATR